jgi:polyphosphate kinase
MATEKLINRELSWLSFNERVLQEAADTHVPLLERLKFLGIYSSNLDEFFRVRVATLKRLAFIGLNSGKSVTQKAQKTLVEIQHKVLSQSERFNAIYEQLRRELEKAGISMVNESRLNANQAAFVRNYYENNVRPALVPIMLNQIKNFPYLKDKSIYLAVKAMDKTSKKGVQYALVEIPTNQLPRFVQIPASGKKQSIILLDDIIRFNLDKLFGYFQFSSLEAYTIKLTRDAELDIENDLSHSFMEKISKSVKARQKGNPVRLVYDREIPSDLLRLITKKLKMVKLDNLIPGGRYHNFKDFMDFPAIGEEHLRYPALKPLEHPALQNNKSVIDSIRSGDLLLHYPYQKFDHFIDLLREAAIDPNVKTIQITLYRLAKKSKVANALINAAQNGKEVKAVVELQARFDEEANIKWARVMAENGIQVTHGVPGLKVHSKLCLITRQEKNKLARYAMISTGNLNEDSAKYYCDTALFTCDSRITKEVEQMFEFMDKNYKVHTYKHLVLSPHKTRKKFIHLIEQEIEFAKKKKPCGIFLKMNSLVDEEMIHKLYEAARAGVPVRLIIRGICRLMNSESPYSNKIEAISIVDRLLEHSRIFIFENGGQPLYFLSSADWMSRNLDYRIELSCPIYDKAAQQQLRDYLEIQWKDNVKARKLDSVQDNQYKKSNLPGRVRAQESIYEYIRKLSPVDKSAR